MEILTRNSSTVYIAYYDITSSLPSLFADIYRFNDLQIGMYQSFSSFTLTASIGDRHVTAVAIAVHFLSPHWSITFFRPR